jgi:hypothetical protein
VWVVIGVVNIVAVIVICVEVVCSGGRFIVEMTSKFGEINCSNIILTATVGLTTMAIMDHFYTSNLSSLFSIFSKVRHSAVQPRGVRDKYWFNNCQNT